MKRLTAEAYTVAWLCALPLSELVAATAMLDEEHEALNHPTHDDNSYTYGSINGHNVIIACMPPGQPGKVSASRLVQPLSKSFPNLKIHLFVGTGGGVPRIPIPHNPEDDIHLGDVVIGYAEQSGVPGVVQWDLVRYLENGNIEPLGILDKPDRQLLNTLSLVLRNRILGRTRFPEHLERLQKFAGFSHPGHELDKLFKSTYHHVGGPNCSSCDQNQLTDRLPRGNQSLIFHQGTILSGDTIMKDPQRRNEISQIYHGALCFEMEAAGVIDDKRCLIIRGIADYADSHTNGLWQNYAAGTAAAFAREFLFTIQPQTINGMESHKKPKPSSTVPFQKDSMFVGRENIIANIRNRHEHAASQNHSRVALVGLGGVGKSQIAIEYAYRVRESVPQIWVFWIHASNSIRFEQAYRDIATNVELPGRDDPKVDILRLVYNWLCDERNGQWLIILDNVDDTDFFFHPDTELPTTGEASLTSSKKESLASFLPQTSNGWILVTSRNLLAAMNLVGMQQNNTIQVEPMNEEDALALLQTRLPVSESTECKARALIQALECIPLAIIQAAAYIRVRASRITFSTYLDLFNESEANQADLLKNEEASDLRRDPSVRHAVITTWQISFEQIRRTKPAAADLLALMSMFDGQGIPEDLLHSNTNKLQFEDAVEPLTSFSLVRTQIDMKSFEMHRLVQFSTRKWLEINQQLDKWRKESLRRVAMKFPSGNYETWRACQVLLPHSNMVLSYLSDKENKDEALNRAEIAYKMTSYLYLRGEYAAAEKVGRIAVEGRVKWLGHENSNTVNSAHNLGSVLDRLGRYEEAEAIHRRCVEEVEKIEGPEHPTMLDVFNGLGTNLDIQGKHVEAEVMHQRSLERNEKMLGPEHPTTIKSVGSLGSVWQRQGRYNEAETMCWRALEGLEKTLGPEHPETLTSVHNLGVVLKTLDKYDEAEAMFRRSLEGREKALGPKHPYTLTSIDNLGSVLLSRGKYEKAEPMLRRSLEHNEKALGQEDPKTLRSVENLGVALRSLGKCEEAEVMFRRSSQGREKVLGPEHLSTLMSIDNLGVVLDTLGKYDETEAMFRRCLEGREKVLGLEHLYTLRSVNNLGSVLLGQGKYDEAEKLLWRCLEGREKVQRPEDPDVLRNVDDLGLVLKCQGMYNEAEVMHRRVFEGNEKTLGPEHPNTLRSVKNLGSALLSQGKYDEAEVMYRRVFEGNEKTLGPEHPNTLQSVNNLGSALLSQDKYDEAEVMHRRVFEGNEKTLGPEHPNTLQSINNLGSVLLRQGKSDEAEKLLRRCLEGNEKVRGAEHSETLRNVADLGLALENQGKFDEAEVMRRRVFEGNEKTLGPEHPKTLSSIFNLAQLLCEQKHYNEASELYHRASNGFEKVLGSSRSLSIICKKSWRFMRSEMKQDDALDAEYLSSLSLFESMV